MLVQCRKRGTRRSIRVHQALIVVLDELEICSNLVILVPQLENLLSKILTHPSALIHEILHFLVDLIGAVSLLFLVFDISQYNTDFDEVIDVNSPF